MTTPLWRSAAIVSALLTFCVLLAPPQAAATQVQYRSLEDLGEEASLVVRGEVSGVRTYWNESRTRILTEVSVRIAERFKGAPAGELRIVQMGGELDGVRMTVAGALEWTTGDDVVLFLEDSLPGRYRVSGFSQGRFDVRRDARTGEEFVVQSGIGGVELVGAAARTTQPARLSLDELLDRARIRALGGE